jgi:hypothetical protein
MKYKTFRNLVVVGGVAVVAGAIAASLSLRRMSAPATPLLAPSGAPPAAPGTSPVPRVPRTEDDSMRQVDRMILSYLESHAATTSKVKDAFPKARFKVNIYRDGTDRHWSRLKIDFDRDDFDDENRKCKTECHPKPSRSRTMLWAVRVMWVASLSWRKWAAR